MSLSKESMLEEIKLLSKKDFIWVKQQLQTWSRAKLTYKRNIRAANTRNTFKLLNDAVNTITNPTFVLKSKPAQYFSVTVSWKDKTFFIEALAGSIKITIDVDSHRSSRMTKTFRVRIPVKPDHDIKVLAQKILEIVENGYNITVTKEIVES
jgi:hypothetical protein